MTTAKLVLACVVSAAALAIPVTVAQAARTTGAILISAPRQGARLSSPVRASLQVGARYALRQLHVTLDGVDVTSYFATVTNGHRTAELSPSQGLSYGSNALTVVLTPLSGPRLRQTVRFKVARILPLAAAGGDLRVAVGPLRLDGAGSLPPSAGLPGASPS